MAKAPIERSAEDDGDPDPTSAGTTGDAALWGGSSVAMGRTANPSGPIEPIQMVGDVLACPAGAWMIDWGGCEAGAASRISFVSFETLVTTWLVEVGCCNRSWSAPRHSSHDRNLHAD